MKKRVWKRRRDGVRQRYWTGRKKKPKRRHSMAIKWGGETEYSDFGVQSSKRVMMSPDEFLRITKRGHIVDEWDTKWKKMAEEDEYVQDLKKHLETKGSRFIPFLEKKEGKFTGEHEGRTRAMIAKLGEEKEIPVDIVTYSMRQGSRRPDLKDYEDIGKLEKYGRKGEVDIPAKKITSKVNTLISTPGLTGPVVTHAVDLVDFNTPDTITVGGKKKPTQKDINKMLEKEFG